MKAQHFLPLRLLTGCRWEHVAGAKTATGADFVSALSFVSDRTLLAFEVKAEASAFLLRSAIRCALLAF